MSEKNIAVEWLTSIFFNDVVAESKDQVERLSEMLGDVHVKYGERTMLSSSAALKEISCVTEIDTNKNYRSIPETCDTVKLVQELETLSVRLTSENLCIQDVFYWMECLVEDNASRHLIRYKGDRSESNSLSVGDTLKYTVTKEDFGVNNKVIFTDKQKNIVYVLSYDFGHVMTTKISKYLIAG